jgi:hypothetical protein
LFYADISRGTQYQKGVSVTVAVLASPEDALSLNKILTSLSSVEVDAYGLKLHEKWESLPRESVVKRLDKASHFLAIATASSISSAWFSFATGFGYSRGSAFALFRSDPDLAIPRYLSGLPVLDSLEELESYYRTEMAGWVVEEERRASRGALLEMGVSVHNDSLAQCAREGDTKAVELFIDRKSVV